LSRIYHNTGCLQHFLPFVLKVLSANIVGDDDFEKRSHLLPEEGKYCTYKFVMND
jgi:hypothetical protein